MERRNHKAIGNISSKKNSKKTKRTMRENKKRKNEQRREIGWKQEQDVLRLSLKILSLGLSLSTLTEQFSNAFKAGVQLCSVACLLPVAPAGKTEMFSADQNWSVMFLFSLPNNLPLETLLLVSAFQFFGNKEDNKGEDELRFFYIFTENDHGRETFLNQWFS